jgi:sugar lactone lactonase YvrE
MRQWALLAVFASACTPAPDPCADGVPGTVCHVAGTGEPGADRMVKPATESALYQPSQVRRGPDGLLYIMDFNNHLLRRIEADGMLTAVAGNGIHAGALEGADARESSLENPVDFDFLPDGRIVFVSYHDARVLMIEHDHTLKVIAGDVPASTGNEGDGGPARDARFVELHGIAIAPDGTIYLADGGANRIRRIGTDGIINTIAGSNVGGYTGDGGPATSARVSAPSAMALDANGLLYFADSNNCVIRRIEQDGTITTVAGNGPIADSELAGPEGFALAPDGSIFIADRRHSVVKQRTPDGQMTVIAGTGTRGHSGDGGPALEAEFSFLSRLFLDSDGSLYVADQQNAVVRRILGVQ